MDKDLEKAVERQRLATRDLSFVISEIDAEETHRFWELVEAGEFEDAILEVEKVAMKCRIGGQFWISLAVAADDFGMTTEAARYLERSELRVRDW